MYCYEELNSIHIYKTFGNTSNNILHSYQGTKLDPVFVLQVTILAG